LHGKDIYFDACADLPAAILNWHDRLTGPTLAEGKRRGAVAAGLGEAGTPRPRPVEAVRAPGGGAPPPTGGGGPPLPPRRRVPRVDVPDAHLQAVIDAARSFRA